MVALLRVVVFDLVAETLVRVAVVLVRFTVALLLVAPVLLRFKVVAVRLAFELA